MIYFIGLKFNGYHFQSLSKAIERMRFEEDEDRYEEGISPLRYMEGRSSNRSSNSESSDNSGLLRSDKVKLTFRN